MGIFNETEEEKNYKKLLKTIRYSNLNTEWKNYLLDYVEEINSGSRVNDFLDFDYLSRFIMTFIDWQDLTEKPIEETMRKILITLKRLLPAGVETPDYKSTMEMFLNNFCGNDGFISTGLFDEKMYALFQNKYDYLYIMSLISHDDWMKNNFSIISNYALDVAPYCTNQEQLKKELLSFINGLEDEYGDLNSYRSDRLIEAKKRCGVYPLDEKSMALLSSQAEKAQSLVKKIESLFKRAESFQERINVTIASGKKDISTAVSDGEKEINSLKNEVLANMKELLDATKKDIIEELDEYLLSLEKSLKDNSDQVFNRILTDTQDRLRKIKLSAESLSQTTASDLLRIQRATEESVSTLKSYVENDPQLKNLLKSAQEDDKIRETILQLKSLENTTSTNDSSIITQPSSNIFIPGYERAVSPANPSIVIPTGEIKRDVIPAFDEAIPFDVRMERILKIKEKLQSQGEIFHEMIDEIIRCIIEGDWVYLWGPSGCGKSYSIKQAARLIGIDLINNGKITDKYSIMAYNDPRGVFRATQTFVALVYGKLLSLDEFDNGNTDTQVVFSDIYSGLLDTLEKPNELSYITFAEDMRMPIHPNFRIISAGNTSGEGENQAFSSRGKIDEAIQQRMTPKKLWYDNRVERRIFGDNTAWYNIFVNFRKVCDDYARKQGLDVPIGIVTTRDASAIVKYIGHNSKSLAQVLDEKFVQTKSLDYLKFIEQSFKRIYNLNDSFKAYEANRLGNNEEVEIAKALVLRCNAKK